MFDKKQETKELEKNGETENIIFNVKQICGVCKKVCDEKSVNCGRPECPLSKKLYS